MKRLWAPWRLTYVSGTMPRKPGCFFCDAWADLGNEPVHLVLARGVRSLAMLNRYPYTNGHLLIAPARHFGNMEEADADEMAEIWRLAVAAKAALTRAFAPDGFNIGINQGKTAGAGVADHLHLHIVPRWNGDCNFMPVLADVRVIPQALEDAFKSLNPIFASLLGKQSGCQALSP